jgi:hypothetical protein
MIVSATANTICHVISLDIKCSEACASHVIVINASLYFK